MQAAEPHCTLKKKKKKKNPKTHVSCTAGRDGKHCLLAPVDAIFSDTCPGESQSCFWKELCALLPCMGMSMSDSVSRT